MGNETPGVWVSLTGSSDGISDATLLEANREWVFIAVDKIARSVAGVRYKVMRWSKNGDDEEVFDGPLVSFLETPSETLTGKDFIYLNTAYKELTGNAFWEKKNKGKYEPLVPNRVQPVISGARITAFKYSDGSALRTIEAKHVLHDRYVDLAKPYWGASRLRKIARWADTSGYVSEFLSRFFTNGATFGGFIETEEESQERINLIKLGLKNDHVGVANAHKLGVLPKGSKFSKVTANMAEMEMGETDDRYRDKILAAFGVPKTIVGLTTEVNRASAEASEYIYAKHTIKPIVDDFIEFLNTTVAPALNASGELYFACDDFVPDNMELKLKEREIALAKNAYMTVNEVRASVGLPPIKGGDVVPTPNVPDPNEERNDKPADEKPKKAAPARMRATLSRDRLVEGIVSKAAEIATAHHDPDAESHKAFVGRVEDHEKLIANKVRDFNNRQERDVALRLKQITKAVQKGDVFDMDGEVTLLVDFISPMLKGLMLEQAIAEYEDQEFPGQLDPAQPRLSNIVEFAAKRVARSYNKTTAKLLSETLNEGINGGEDLTQLADRVKQVYEFSNTVRAAAVARTEAFYIANEGSREAFLQSGVVKTMRWYTAEDERVCEFCGPQHGRTIGVSEYFFPKDHELDGTDGGKLKLDYRAIDVPPLHTNCRCFIRPERIDV